MTLPIHAHLKPRRITRLGWIPDTPDQRDHTFEPKAGRLPARQSLRDQMPNPLDQGQLGSCAPNATAAVFMHAEITAGRFPIIPSRLFVYYGARFIEGTVRQDAGSMIRDCVKVVHKVGAPPETDWPYVIGRFDVQPPARAYADAKLEQAIEYRRVAKDHVRAVVAAGYPVIAGTTLYESFDTDETAATGVIPNPEPGEQPIGGHAFAVIGYDTKHDAGDRDECQNSWGPAWGDNGRFWLPKGYLQKHGADFWTIHTVA